MRRLSSLSPIAQGHLEVEPPRAKAIDAAELMARFGGGGHQRAGGAPLLIDEAEEKIEEILAELKRNG